MTPNQCDIGLIGLAVMGENLVLNMDSKGFSVAVFNRTTEVTNKFAAGRAKDKKILPTRTLEEFVGALTRPRKAMIMVKAGAPVDAVIQQIAPLLEKGDVIIDGGNSLFTDTQRRGKELEGTGIHFVGMGVSGGEEGALKGPSLMPGGSRESWAVIAAMFRKIDPDTGKPLVDMILDKAGQKGTGIWTLQSAIRQSVVISTINAAVEARVVSSRKEERVAASKILPQPRARKFKGNRARFVDSIRDALYASKIVSYAQGMELLRSGSTEYKWNLNLSDIATIWRGGCIIRAKFLNRIVEAYHRNPALHNLLLDRYFTKIIKKAQRNWRVAVSTAIKHGVAVPAFSASLAYFDSYRQARLPANLLQAQRDFFGAHTYERIDKPGVFHTEWIESDQKPAEKPTEPKTPEPHHAGE